ncbi:hypothetical protein ILUMI_24686 [Ignelater luminosus]|uniref:TIL domain-containing protein n=1 Tax=Ignelater luminosus TaxID=2038154 RepID=A0A8K0G0N2_IGNLU|nr:hypothetical protein ILUMI_24686 [Ignelater luminosus]
MKLILALYVFTLGIPTRCTNYLWEPRISLPGQCGKKEYYSYCGSRCAANCYNVQFNVPCPSHQCASGCFCQGGYLRSRYYGPCVDEIRCKQAIRKRGFPKNQRKRLAKVMEDYMMHSTEG